MKDFGPCELRPLDAMNSSMVCSSSCIHGSKFYEQLKAIDDMNNSGL